MATLKQKYAKHFKVPLEQVRHIEFLTPDDHECFAVGSPGLPHWTTEGKAPTWVAQELLSVEPEPPAGVKTGG